VKNILLAINIDNEDESIINMGLSLAEKYDSKLWIVHVAAPDPDFVGYEVGPSYVRDTRAEELRNEHIKLRGLMKLADSRNVESEALLIQGPTVEMLTKEIRKLNIDMIIIGSHKHGFMYETFVGHTSVKLLKKIHIPILIVPTNGE